MNQSEFTAQELTQLFYTCNDQGKKLLEEKFGHETFDFDPVRDVHSLEDACRYNGSDIKNVIPWKEPINDDQRCVNAFATFIEIYRAFNKKKVPVWGTGTPAKYFAWINMPTPSGLGLSLLDTVFVISFSIVPARLTLFNKAHVEIIFNRFPELWKDLMVYN